MAYALAGDAPHAQSLADDLTKRFPQDTVVAVGLAAPSVTLR